MIPVVARNAAWVALASEFPNSDLIHSEAFIRAIDRALESAAPHLMADAWEEGREVGLAQDFDATTQITNPYGSRG